MFGRAILKNVEIKLIQTAIENRNWDQSTHIWAASSIKKFIRASN